MLSSSLHSPSMQRTAAWRWNQGTVRTDHMWNHQVDVQCVYKVTHIPSRPLAVPCGSSLTQQSLSHCRALGTGDQSIGRFDRIEADRLSAARRHDQLLAAAAAVDDRLRGAHEVRRDCTAMYHICTPSPQKNRP